MDKCGAAAEELQKDQNVGADRVYPMKLNLASFQSIGDFALNFKASKLLSDNWNIIDVGCYKSISNAQFI